MSLLELFEPVDASNHGGFTRAGGPHTTMRSPFDFQVDVLQYMKLAIPFVEILDDDDVFI